MTIDSSNVRIPEAAVMPCPTVQSVPNGMRDLAYGFVRLLDKAGKFVGLA
jgi:hypothetical protein